MADEIANTWFVAPQPVLAATDKGPMYKVALIPTIHLPRKEEWLDAEAVRQSRSGGFWEFLDSGGAVIRSIEKSRVIAFQVAPDRRQPRDSRQAKSTVPTALVDHAPSTPFKGKGLNQDGATLGRARFLPS